MATIKRFEDLELWQIARELAKKVKVITETELFSRDFRFRDQTNASAGSVMDNIAEGFERSGRLEFVNFLSIARGSCNEVKSQVYRASDRKYINEVETQQLMQSAEKIIGMISSFMNYLQSYEQKGTKFMVSEPEAIYGFPKKP